MKVIFLALLLLNLGWLAWAQWLSPSSSPQSGAAAAGPRGALVGAGRIQLAGEAAEEPARPASVAAAAQCLAVGPFRDAAAVSAALAYLERHGHVPRVRPGPEFWIEIRVETPVAAGSAPRALFWEHPDMTTAEHAEMGDPEAWRFAPCEPQAEQPPAG